MSRGKSLMALLTCALVLGAHSNAQTPATVNLAGTWTFDSYLSDNPQQVAAAIRADLGQTESTLFGDPMEGSRYGRGGYGRRGQPPQGAGRTTPPSAEEQKTIDALTQPVRYPPTTLRISQAPDSITLGDQANAQTLQTNGKREPQVLDTVRVERAARWEGPQLIVDFDLGKGRKMTYTYSLAPTTHQLVVRVTFERAPNQPGPFEIKFVYDPAAS